MWSANGFNICNSPFNIVTLVLISLYLVSTHFLRVLTTIIIISVICKNASTFFDKIVKKRGKKFFNRLYKPKRSITFDYAPLIALFYFHINKVCAFCCQSSVLLPLPCAKSGLPPPRPLKISFAFLQYSRQSALTPSEWPNI